MPASIRQSFLLSIKNLIYPDRCAICGEVCAPREGFCHEACRNKPRLIHEPVCKRCGAPLSDSDIEYCLRCETQAYSFDLGMALWVYDDITRKSISFFKFKNYRDNAKYYTDCMAKELGQRILAVKPDMLVPVPIHKSKRRERGYNQAELLAEGLSKALSVPVAEDILFRNKKTVPQKELSAAERLRNLSDAFYCDMERLERYPKHNSIMLIDDIYTTGSTMEACTGILKQAGVKKVYFAVLCSAPGYSGE